MLYLRKMITKSRRFYLVDILRTNCCTKEYIVYKVAVFKFNLKNQSKYLKMKNSELEDRGCRSSCCYLIENA